MKRSRMRFLRFIVIGLSVCVAPNSPVDQPRVFHILNWHFVSREMFAAERPHSIADDELDQHYEEFLNEVEAVQKEQIKELRQLIQKYNLTHIYVEGFSKEQLPAFREWIDVLRRAEQREPKGDSPIDLLLRHQLRLDLLEIGAAGRLMIDGEVDVLPVEDADLLQQANPIRDGHIQFDSTINEEREDALVRNLLKGGPVVVLVMGGAHDLSNNVPYGCKYERISTKAYRMATMD